MEEKNMSPDLEKNIEKWLETQGYPLEMIVAQAFRKNEFKVFQSDYYRDYESNKMREIDIYAVQWSYGKSNVNLQVFFAIECKLAIKKPWVLFTSEVEEEYIGLPFNIIGSNLFRVTVFEEYKNAEFRNKISKLSQYNFPRVGFSLKQAFKDGSDVPFEALSSAVKAVVSRSKNFSDLYHNTDVFNLCVGFPVVVIEGRLYECSLDKNNHITTSEIDHGVLLWKGVELLEHSTPFIHIYTKKALDYFINTAKSDAKILFESFEKKYNEVRKYGAEMVEVEKRKERGLFYNQS